MENKHNGHPAAECGSRGCLTPNTDYADGEREGIAKGLEMAAGLMGGFNCCDVDCEDRFDKRRERLYDKAAEIRGEK